MSDSFFEFPTHLSLTDSVCKDAVASKQIRIECRGKYMCFKRICDSDAVSLHIGNESYWALRDSVGYGCPNNELDVFLVQFFLNMAEAERVAAKNGGWSDGARQIEEDGRFGGETWGAIKRFQKRFGNFADGTVSAAKGDRLTSPNSGRVYTLLEMNRLYARCRRYAYDNLTIDPDLPIALFSHFLFDDIDWDDEQS